MAGNPLPIVTVNVSPAEVRVGSSGLYLQISVDPASALASTEVLNGLTALPTDTRQRASGILLAYLANVGPAGMIDVNVSNPAPGGGRTFAGGITVLTTGNALPAVTAMTPSLAAAGAADTTVTLDGTNFVTGGKVVIRSFPNQVTLTPGAVSATQVTFTLPAAQLTTAASFSVVYVNPTPGGGNSAAQTFTVQ
ncbi:MAG: cell surface receptor domain protein [Myxococcaceae bacterium]|nr:cell surface receptor domain protein [Myxococcaceae bacterium]